MRGDLPCDVQIAARHADPRNTMRYDRARKNLDRMVTRGGRTRGCCPMAQAHITVVTVAAAVTLTETYRR
jgi:hypothetical protein